VVQHCPQGELVIFFFNQKSAVFNAAKPGVNWQDLHILAEKTVIEGLLALGVLVGGTVQELWEKRISYYFMPHGLGHYIGIYTHDLKGDHAKEDMRKPIEKQSLRVYRILEEGMCLTNEPGCYIIEGLHEEARQCEDVNQHINWEKLDEYRPEIMACRIEDNFVVTKDGCEKYTFLPRTVEAIEACYRGEEWASLNFPDFKFNL
jgi:Xaa-Pro dipeptidase